MESMDTEFQTNDVEKSLSIVVQSPESTRTLSWTGEQNINRISIKLEYEGDKSEVKGFRTSSALIYLLYGSIFLFTNQTKVVFVPQYLL